MMYSYNWDEIKWIFEPDGALRDIYVKDVSIEDWKDLIDFLILNFTLKFGPVNKERCDSIDKLQTIEFLTGDTGEMESKTISILIDEILINCHLFSELQIEFDIDPKEIKTSLELNKVLNFMGQISKRLNKVIILTGENQADFPLIIIQENGIMEYLTKGEAVKKWNT